MTEEMLPLRLDLVQRHAWTGMTWWFMGIWRNDEEMVETLCYPVVNGGSDSVWGIHIPYIFPIEWGAKELIRVSQPSNSSGYVKIANWNMGHFYS